MPWGLNFGQLWDKKSSIFWNTIHTTLNIPFIDALVMIVLPAGASIGAFIMSVIGWYGVVRNGIQVIYSDYRAVKSFDRDIKGLGEGFSKQQRRLEEWKMQWLVSEDAPQSMFLDFWGDVEHQAIKTLLSGMVENCNLAEKDLKPFMKLDKEKWNAMKGCAKRIYFIGVKGKPLRELLQQIEGAADGLDAAAKAGWRRKDYVRKESIDFKAVYHTGIGRLLIPIAMQTKADADALHASCRSAQGTLKLELDLDIFDSRKTVFTTQPGGPTSSIGFSRESSAAEIAKAAKNGLFTWKLLVVQDSQEDTNSFRMQINRVQVPQSRCLSVPVALDNIMKSNIDQSHFTFAGIYFSIAMAQDSNHYSPRPHQTLRHLLSENQPPSFRNEDMLGKISKFRVAFELAQACLLLLRTTWFPRICSCHLQCALCAPASEEHTYDFGLHMGSIDHQVPRWAATNGSCWGIDNYNWNSLTRPLRHSGLLLIEIVIGTPIYRIDVDDASAIRSISFMRSDPPAEMTPSTMNLGNILADVRTAFSGREAAENAVRYCLTKVCPEAPTDEEMKALLAEYYVDVVAPYEYLSD